MGPRCWHTNLHADRDLESKGLVSGFELGLKRPRELAHKLHIDRTLRDKG